MMQLLLFVHEEDIWYSLEGFLKRGNVDQVGQVEMWTMTGS